MLMTEQNYRHIETFDTNLTTGYEIDKWSNWHIIREFISNALDGVNGDAQRISVTVEDGFVHISDHGQGYPLVFAKRIGATSKRNDCGSIGQFGEGTKMAILTGLRMGIEVRLASKDWLIVPRIAPTEQEGIQVLLFDVFQAESPIEGSLVSVQATPEILDVVHDKDEYFLHFETQTPLFGTLTNGIYPMGKIAKLYNKGVYVKNLEALYSYALSLNELNRDRELVDDNVLCRAIRSLWEKVGNPELISEYYLASHRAGDSNSPYKELSFYIYPENKEIWTKSFNGVFGEKAVLYTNPLAAREAILLGYEPYQIEYYGRSLAEHVGVVRDIDVIRTDYEFAWVENLTLKEQQRLILFRQIAGMLDLHLPKDIRIFKTYAKSDNLAGHFNEELDEVYIKREVMGGELPSALEVFLHELNHRETGADDYSRAFADGLVELLAQAALELASCVGISINLELDKSGLQLPPEFSFAANELEGQVTAVGEELIIQAAGYKLRATVPGADFKPHRSLRKVTCAKGHFYLSIPRFIHEQLPTVLPFRLLMDIEGV